jgi:hypothetical protein
VKHAHLPLFMAQRSQFTLRFTCEHCCNFVVEDERCAHGYPNREHRAAYYEQAESVLVFCKEFELQ